MSLLGSVSDTDIYDTDSYDTDSNNNIQYENIKNVEQIVANTKYFLLPILYLICIIGIVQILLLNIDITINDIIIINISNNFKTFNIAFIITLLITIFGSIISIYFEYKWSLLYVMLNRNDIIKNKYLLNNINKKRSKILKYKKEIKFKMKILEKNHYENNKLELISKFLNNYKKELNIFQRKYQQKTKRKIFKNYSKEIEKQCIEIKQIINENQLVILSIILCELRISNKNKCNIISHDKYNDYLKYFNSNTINEFNFCGGFISICKNNQNFAEIVQFENLIENVIDVIDENQCTFVNY